MKKKNKLTLSVLFSFLFFFSIGCNDKPTESQLGIIAVIVVDNDVAETPVPGVEITITPGDLAKQTDANGLCSFEIDPGAYYVDAEVCCIGPGYIHYHEPVTVVENETTEVTLLACLRCL